MPKRVFEPQKRSTKLIGRSQHYAQRAKGAAESGDMGAARFATSRSISDLRRGKRLQKKGK